MLLHMKGEREGEGEGEGSEGCQVDREPDLDNKISKTIIMKFNFLIVFTVTNDCTQPV